jgi:hypothetical protein
MRPVPTGWMAVVGGRAGTPIDAEGRRCVGGSRVCRRGAGAGCGDHARGFLLG